MSRLRSTLPGRHLQVVDIPWDRCLQANDHVVCSHMSSEPSALLASLAANGPDRALRIMMGVPFTQAIVNAPAAYEITCLGGMGSAAAMAEHRRMQVSMLPYGQISRVYEDGRWPVDVVLVSLARSSSGRLYLGASHGSVLAATRRARCVIAEINQQAPCILGAEWPEDLRIDLCVDVSHEPAPVSSDEPGEVERAMAGHIAELVPDGACLQVGIGGLPSAVLQALEGHRHLGVHSGMFTAPMQRLCEKGVIDNSRKQRDVGISVTGCVLGDASTYRFASGNTSLRLREADYTHNSDVIASQPDFFSINSALEVDLLGHVNAETVEGAEGRWRYVGGVGGLPEFVRAASTAKRGQSVMALSSRTPKGKPKIVARLSGPTTVAAADVDRVVTEQGVAVLRHAGVGQRVQQMLAVAHPEDREALTAQARKLGLLN